MADKGVGQDLLCCSHNLRAGPLEYQTPGSALVSILTEVHTPMVRGGTIFPECKGWGLSSPLMGGVKFPATKFPARGRDVSDDSSF